MKYSEEDLLALAIKLIYEWNDHALPAKVIEEEARKAVEEFKKENENKCKNRGLNKGFSRGAIRGLY